MKTILVIEDDGDFASALRFSLGADFQVVEARDGDSGIRIACETRPDAILLDVSLPNCDGFEVCQRLRAIPSTHFTPILMLTGHSDLESRVKGLQFGADDYICKPFHIRELRARISAQVRKCARQSDEQATIVAGNLELNLGSQKAQVNGAGVDLTHLEFRLLRFMVENRNQLISRRNLLGAIWPDAVVAPRTVDTHVANLRKKLLPWSCSLETVYGGGYIVNVA